ncbi:MAG: hypothetical protein WCJ64_05045 [Rhodospirillaceae bacterium]
MLGPDDKIIGRIEVFGSFPCPGLVGGRDGKSGEETLWDDSLSRADVQAKIRSADLDTFILTAIRRIRESTSEKLAGEPTMWGRLMRSWTSEDDDLREPPREPIVTIAERMHALVGELEERPRVVLRRIRERTPVSRVQQLDVPCIRWLSRQPGVEVHERAGPRQRIMAVAREETRDTLENRVFRDFTDLCRETARGYTKRHETFKSTARWLSVSKFGSECSRINSRLEAEGIGLLNHPVRPNYALLHDRRYRLVWKHWQDLIKRRSEKDEAWRWQHRLWADFCQLALHLSLRRSPASELVAECPLRIRGEQARGVWSSLDSQSGVFVLTANRRQFAVSLILDPGKDHDLIEPWMRSVGPTAVVRLQPLFDDRLPDCCVFVWPIHMLTRDPKAKLLAQLVRSAGESLDAAVEQARREHDCRIKAIGLVLLSSVIESERETEILLPPNRQTVSGGMCLSPANFWAKAGPFPLGRSELSLDMIIRLLASALQRLYS